MYLRSLAAATTLLAGLTAQSLTVPNGMATTNTGVSGLTWRTTAFRFQMIYDTTHFTAQGVTTPIQINRMRFRANGGLTSPGGETYTGVTAQMSSCPLDWNSASTTFASNRGTDVQTVFTGNVVCLAAAGTSPNTNIIDIVLTTPFIYDPSQGLDLCVEIDAPAPVPNTVPNMATSSTAGEMARRISQNSQTATTGAASAFASVILFDYTLLPNAASATNFGAGCNSEAQTFYEDLAAGAFDLSNSSILMTPTANGYAVAPGSNNWFTPTSANLGLADDALSPVQALPFTFTHPGGSTTGIKICSNGFIWLDTTPTTAAASGGGATLALEAARLAMLWNDLDPSVGGTIHFDVDPSGLVVYATWLAVPRWNVTPAELVTMQAAIFSNGDIEMRYQTCQNGPGCVGFSPAANGRNPGTVDLSAAMPFVTGPDTTPLGLSSNRPKLGIMGNLNITGIPAGATLGMVVLSLTQLNPGVDLAPFGMPTCTQYVPMDSVSSFVPAGTSHVFSAQVPNAPSLAGLHVYVQAAALAAGVNTLGAIASNGVDLKLDLN